MLCTYGLLFGTRSHQPHTYHYGYTVHSPLQQLQVPIVETFGSTHAFLTNLDGTFCLVSAWLPALSIPVLFDRFQ